MISGDGLARERFSTEREGIPQCGQSSLRPVSHRSPAGTRARAKPPARIHDPIENGAPVSVETVKSGLPVTVNFTREGDRMNAVKVIVHL